MSASTVVSDDLWTPEQVADLIGVTPDTLRAWRHRGGGPVYTKPGKAVLYFKSDVMAWLQSRRHSRTDTPERV